ncbi:facilitated trehalose transporter Tret1-like isoform X3 [Huso huso]|uniref:Facilitated trehalose transporter Tret1-like isoform X3 n=1 Tax=Huso huso TaxID=61971 RepID=A0ABR0YDQ7_HUSHU
MGYQYCRRYMQTHSGPDTTGTQPPLTLAQRSTPTPVCSTQRHSVDASLIQQRSPSPSQRDVNAQPDILQRDQRPLADTPQNCSPASHDQVEEEDLSGMVAEQLRIIGDEMNKIYQQRRQNEVQHWRHWRGVWRGLYNFITETLTAAYLPGLR